ncbi:MAG: hypothetical protein ACTSRS_07080 [Candidatus Helarchaeota archaeon]
MDATQLYNSLVEYFPKNPDLMTALKPGAIWEYEIRAPTLEGEQSEVVLVFHLFKKEDGTIKMVRGTAPTKPDLILYFTEKAILNLISNAPTAHKYYELYRKIMANPTDEIDLDYKVNKPRLKLWRMGYRTWSKIYKFSHIQA